ncbi:serine hydrolase domain-containing protein [Sphingomonas sp. GB1N7]|uniref:serine hydrolase domain-containing protein n=1 Tax=Parasphingomonas caseinilytica TaxID=3096158 RepID=UPI002FC9C035
MKGLFLAGLVLIATPAAAETVDEVAVRYKLAGEVLVARGNKVLIDKGYGTIKPSGGASHKPRERWRLASITKQVTAALVMQDVASGKLTLDQNYPWVVDAPFVGATPRMLLTHQSGVANPDDTPQNAVGVPSFYAGVTPDVSYCYSVGARIAPFKYNNCDYILLGELARIVAQHPIEARWPKGMAMARTGEKGVPGFVGGKLDPAFELASWGAAGGLMGTAQAVFAFDRSLMTGRLLPPFARDALWTPEGKGSYQALGQWVFPGKLKGCVAPKRIVQRDGEIYGVQARNFIFPDDDLVVIVFTNRSSEDFQMGEVWEAKGFVYDLLSAAACS